MSASLFSCKKYETIVESPSLRTAVQKKYIYFTVQDSTAHDSTSQRNPPLLLSIICACHRASKKRKFRPGKSLWPFSGIWWSLAGSWLSWAGIRGRNKNASWQSFSASWYSITDAGAAQEEDGAGATSSVTGEGAVKVTMCAGAASQSQDLALQG